MLEILSGHSPQVWWSRHPCVQSQQSWKNTLASTKLSASWPDSHWWDHEADLREDIDDSLPQYSFVLSWSYIWTRFRFFVFLFLPSCSHSSSCWWALRSTTNRLSPVFTACFINNITWDSDTDHVVFICILVLVFHLMAQSNSLPLWDQSEWSTSRPRTGSNPLHLH